PQHLPSVISAVPWCCLQNRKCESLPIQIDACHPYQIVSDERTFARLPVGVNEVANVGETFRTSLLYVTRRQVGSPRAELLDGLRGSAGDFLDRGDATFSCRFKFNITWEPSDCRGQVLLRLSVARGLR